LPRRASCFVDDDDDDAPLMDRPTGDGWTNKRLG
jgi:hypothetical protein